MKTYTEINAEKTKPMDAGNVALTLRNTQTDWNTFQHHVNAAFAVIDKTAKANAKLNATWHDDPDAEDHRDFHASADKQYPFPVRKADFIEAMGYALSNIEDARRTRYLVKFTGRERGAIGIATARKGIVWALNEEDALNQLFYADSYRFEYMATSKHDMYCEVSEIVGH